MMPLPVSAAQIRRGVLFLINIGVPVLVGVLRGEPQAALLGGIVGMVFAFADNEESLFGRYRLLVFDGAALALGGVAGYFFRHSPALVWPAFIVIVLAVGLAARLGREPLLAGRHGAMAFTVAAAIPQFNAFEIWYVAGAFALNAASRAVDYWLLGPLPRQPGPKLQLPSGQAGWLRFTLAFAGAATAARWIGQALDPVHTIWVVSTTILVMQADARASYRRIVERITGTFAGVVAAWFVTTVSHSAIVICGFILVVAPLIPHHLANRYWLHTALIAFMILLAYDLTQLNSQSIDSLIMARTQDMLLGCAMALVGTAAAFPRAAVAQIDDLLDGADQDE